MAEILLVFGWGGPTLPSICPLHYFAPGQQAEARRKLPGPIQAIGPYWISYQFMNDHFLRRFNPLSAGFAKTHSFSAACIKRPFDDGYPQVEFARLRRLGCRQR